MAGLHGGARRGAGKKPKSDAAPTDAASQFDDPLAYLIAVATGVEPADNSRIAAAKAALPYTSPKTRAPIASPPPQKLRASTAIAADRAEADDFHKRAAEVRRRLASKKGTT